MNSTPSMKKTSSNRVYHEVKISCSQFVRFFLASDAQVFKRNFNGHVNHIIKLHLAGKLIQEKNVKTLNDFLPQPLPNKNSWHIHIYLYQTVYEKLKTQDIASISNLIEQAIDEYIVFVLNHPEHAETSRDIVKKIYENITSFDSKPKTLDDTKKTKGGRCSG